MANPETGLNHPAAKRFRTNLWEAQQAKQPAAALVRRLRVLNDFERFAEPGIDRDRMRIQLHAELSAVALKRDFSRLAVPKEQLHAIAPLSAADLDQHPAFTVPCNLYVAPTLDRQPAVVPFGDQPAQTLPQNSRNAMHRDTHTGPSRAVSQRSTPANMTAPSVTQPEHDLRPSKSHFERPSMHDDRGAGAGHGGGKGHDRSGGYGGGKGYAEQGKGGGYGGGNGYNEQGKGGGYGGKGGDERAGEEPSDSGFVSARAQLRIDQAKRGEKPTVGNKPRVSGLKRPKPAGAQPGQNWAAKAAQNAANGNQSGNGANAEAEQYNIPEELIDHPELKNVELRMVEQVLNEVLESSSVAWADIAGLTRQKQCMKEVVVFPMKRPDLFTGLRAPPKGVLLFGPPGTGKTMIGKAIASESGARFFNISASSLMSKWVGEGERMVKALFSVARCYNPSVVFVDEIDSLLSQRTSGDQESSRRVKTEFLVQIDGAAESKASRVLLVGATNRPQELDEAARRRLVKRLYIPLPDSEGRSAMVRHLLNKDNHGNALNDTEMQGIMEQSAGFSGADMHTLCSDAAMGPVREQMNNMDNIDNIDVTNVRPIAFEDFTSSFRQVRASVSPSEIQGYVDWNVQFGTFQF